MPPDKKRTSPEPNAPEEEGPQTPGSPPQKKLRITQKQKQALIDNLQLELTERARKLRAHYALQAQDLRARVERRVNRIPVSLRKQTMGELLRKHAESQKEASKSHEASRKPAAKNTKKAAAPGGKAAAAAGKKGIKVGKRKSDELHTSDKENAPAEDPPLSNPKKRSKFNAAAGQSRAVSQLANSEVTDARILSPKSSNSRTFPRSPLKSPSKTHNQQYNSHQPSPLKAASPAKATASRMSTATTARAARGDANSQKTNAQENIVPSTKGKKAPANSTTSGPTTYSSPRKAPPSRPGTRTHNRDVSTSTTMSNTSNGTTVVKSTRGNTTNTGTVRKATQPANSTSTAAAKKQSVPRGLASTASSAAKKVAGTSKKQSGVEPPAPGRRVLRNRG